MDALLNDFLQDADLVSLGHPRGHEHDEEVLKVSELYRRHVLREEQGADLVDQGLLVFERLPVGKAFLLE